MCYAVVLCNLSTILVLALPISASFALHVFLLTILKEWHLLKRCFGRMQRIDGVVLCELASYHPLLLASACLPRFYGI